VSAVSINGPDQALRRWVSAWAARYPDHLDQQVAHLAGVELLERKDWVTVARWKFEEGDRRRLKNALAGIAAVEDDEVLEMLSRAALATTDDVLAQKAICVPRSVGPALGSALLMVARPDRYTVYDIRASASITELGGHLSRWHPQRWLDYLRACRDIAHRCHESLRTVDRALYEANGDNRMPEM
jgi:hypothetical protein